ncbi:MAG TPA: alcohol dehydrogenase, partial [Marinobacter sp.]|nr:alcohol dehydrogenase [Marinobacter sp.]
MKKWTFLIMITGAAGLALAFTLGQVLPGFRTTSSHLEVNITDPELIKKGEYIARTADCIACHTVLGKENFAGG